MNQWFLVPLFGFFAAFVQQFPSFGFSLTFVEAGLSNEEILQQIQIAPGLLTNNQGVTTADFNGLILSASNAQFYFTGLEIPSLRGIGSYPESSLTFAAPNLKANQTLTALFGVFQPQSAGEVLGYTGGFGASYFNFGDLWQLQVMPGESVLADFYQGKGGIIVPTQVYVSTIPTTDPGNSQSVPEPTMVPGLILAGGLLWLNRKRAFGSRKRIA